MKSIGLALATFALVCAFAHSEDSVVSAEREYALAIEKAAADRDAKIDAAREQLLATLRAAQMVATKAGDLDAAVKIRDKVRTFEMKFSSKNRTAGQETQPSKMKAEGVEVASAINAYLDMVRASNNDTPEATVKARTDSLLAACRASPQTARNILKKALIESKEDNAGFRNPEMNDRMAILGTLHVAAAEIESDEFNAVLEKIIFDQNEGLNVRILALLTYPALNKSDETIDLCIKLIDAKSSAGEHKSLKYVPIQVLGQLGKKAAKAIPALKRFQLQSFNLLGENDPCGIYTFVAIDCIETDQPIVPFESWAEKLIKTTPKGSDKDWGIAVNTELLTRRIPAVKAQAQGERVRNTRDEGPFGSDFSKRLKEAVQKRIRDLPDKIIKEIGN